MKSVAYNPAIDAERDAERLSSLLQTEIKKEMPSLADTMFNATISGSTILITCYRGSYAAMPGLQISAILVKICQSLRPGIRAIKVRNPVGSKWSWVTIWTRAERQEFRLTAEQERLNDALSR